MRVPGRARRAARPLVLVLPVAFAGCVAPATTPRAAAGPAVAAVYVVDRGWHTEIGLAAENVRGPLAAVEQPFPGVRYLTFGFGERAFFTSRRTDIFSMLRALLPSPAAILVTALRATPAAAFGQSRAVALPLDAAGVEGLDAFLLSYLRAEGGGRPGVLGPGPYPGSLFYAARGTYDAAFTCNTWTAAALHAAGLPISDAGVVFAGQVMDRARRLAASTGRGLPVGAGDAAGRHDDGGVRSGRRRIAAAEADAAGQ